MIKANFNTYNNYVTDSLYQWDKNRDLVINGLNLSVAPEIHFANADMDRAIVKWSTLEGGVVTVRIPNSLLQSALTIKAYVGIYEDEAFKVVETIEIPVIAKTKPADYVIEDSDEEIYSFKALEYKVVNLETAISTVEDDTKTLKERLNNIFANNDTEGNAELLDIRYGANGKTYASAGEAIRTQFNEVSKTLVFDTKNQLLAWIGSINLFPTPNAALSTCNLVPNEDGTFNITGYNSAPQLVLSGFPTLDPGVYTFTTSHDSVFELAIGNDDEGNVIRVKNGETFTLHKKTATFLYMLEVSQAINNVWVQIVSGAEVKDFVPYIIPYVREDGVLFKNCNPGDTFYVSEKDTPTYWYDGSELHIFENDTYSRQEVDAMIGDLGTVLDNIIELQNSIIGDI